MWQRAPEVPRFNPCAKVRFVLTTRGDPADGTPFFCVRLFGCLVSLKEKRELSASVSASLKARQCGENASLARGLPRAKKTATLDASLPGDVRAEAVAFGFGNAGRKR